MFFIYIFMWKFLVPTDWIFELNFWIQFTVVLFSIPELWVENLGEQVLYILKWKYIKLIFLNLQPNRSILSDKSLVGYRS